MKLFLIFILFCACGFSSAQQIADYKFVIVPTRFTDFDANEYQLNTYSRVLLKQKNYEVIGTEKDQWPQAVQLNPCLAVSLDVKNSSSMFKNKLTLEFRDCNNSLVESIEAKSNIKDFKKGYQDALKTAFNDVEMQNPQAVKTVEQKKVVIIEKSKVPKEDFYQKQIDNTPIAKEQPLRAKKILQTDGNFYLVSEDETTIIAKYTKSTQKGIYHVQIVENTTECPTIGYENGQKISYEVMDEHGDWLLKTYLVD